MEPIQSCWHCCDPMIELLLLLARKNATQEGAGCCYLLKGNAEAERFLSVNNGL